MLETNLGLKDQGRLLTDEELPKQSAMRPIDMSVWKSDWS